MKWILPLLLAISLLGCATNADRQFALNQTLLAYEKTMRWGDFANLLNFRQSNTDQDILQIGQYKNTRVSGYVLKRRLPSQDEFNVTLDVEISYFKTHDNRILSVVDKQTWYYDKETDRWYINSPLPEFK